MPPAPPAKPIHAPAWKPTLWAASGIVAALAAILLVANLSFLDSEGRSNATDTWVSLAVGAVGLGAAGLGRRRAGPRHLFAGGAGVSLGFAAAAIDGGFGFLLVLPAVYGSLWVPMPRPLRVVAGVIGVVFLAMTLQAGIGPSDRAFSPYAGLAAASLVFGFLALWAWREPSPGWSRALWAAAGLWSLLALAVAAADLTAYVDGQGVATLALAAGLGVLAAWAARRLPGRAGTAGG